MGSWIGIGVSSGWLHHRRRERREGYGEDDREARREVVVLISGSLLVFCFEGVQFAALSSRDRERVDRDQLSN